jgi:uncharacterized membrane protein HdeD (DUF308 family)
MDEFVTETADPRDEIVRLEARIEQLAAKIENCRKVALASRIAVALGGAILLALLAGAIRFDAVAMMVGIAAALGGIVLMGSNRSTANEAQAQLAAAEALRAELIGRIGLRTVEGARTLH